jgi:DNA-binding transcriptional regulator YiaG
MQMLPARTTGLGEWIQAKRQEKNLTRRHQSAKMGIATALIQSWESGADGPDDMQRQMLFRVLGSDGQMLQFASGVL